MTLLIQSNIYETPSKIRDLTEIAVNKNLIHIVKTDNHVY